MGNVPAKALLANRVGAGRGAHPDGVAKNLESDRGSALYTSDGCTHKGDEAIGRSASTARSSPCLILLISGTIWRRLRELLCDALECLELLGGQSRTQRMPASDDFGEGNRLHRESLEVFWFPSGAWPTSASSLPRRLQLRPLGHAANHSNRIGRRSCPCRAPGTIQTSANRFQSSEIRKPGSGRRQRDRRAMLRQIRLSPRNVCEQQPAHVLQALLYELLHLVKLRVQTGSVRVEQLLANAVEFLLAFC